MLRCTTDNLGEDSIATDPQITVEVEQTRNEEGQWFLNKWNFLNETDADFDYGRDADFH